MALTREDLGHLTETDAKEIDKWFSNYDKKIHRGATRPFIGKYIKGSLILIPNAPDQETPEMVFEDCCFEFGIRLDRSHYKNKIQFSNCTFEGAVEIRNSSSDADIEFCGCEFQIHFMVIESKLKSLLFESSCPVFRIDGSTIEQCFIYSENYHEAPRYVEHMTIDFRSTIGSISIGNIDVGWMEFYNSIAKDTELLIREVKFQNLVFRDMLNNGKIRLIELEPLNNPTARAEFSISTCNAGKCEFVNLDFRKLHFLHFKSVYLIDCTFVNVIWPESFNLTPYSGEASALLDRKETYRQLKYSYSKQGDSILEHKFHGLEMDTYIEYLEEVLKTEKISRSRYWNLRQTLVVLQLSNWTSDFGQSLWRPIRTILYIGMPLYIVTIISGGIDHYYFSWTDFSVPAMLDTFPGFLWFINPLRKYENIVADWGLLPDFLMRIISSYCIFNFVRATRRFVK